MFAQTLAQSAYSAVTTDLSAPRSSEYEAFARITRALKAAAPGPRRVAALHENRRLWTVLATNVADADNALPSTLRAQIFYLAEFTQLQTSKILRENADPGILIEINTAVMRGLRQQQAAVR